VVPAHLPRRMDRAGCLGIASLMGGIFVEKQRGVASWKRLDGPGAMSLTMLALASYFIVALARGDQRTEKRVVFKSVAAEAFSVPRSASGSVARLQCNKLGHAMLTLGDPVKTSSIIVGCDEEPAVRLADDRAKTTCLFSLLEAHRPSLSIENAGLDNRVALGVLDGDTSALFVEDGGAKVGASIAVLDDNSSSLKLSKNGRQRLWMSVKAKDTVILLNNAGNAVRSVLEQKGVGVPAFHLVDSRLRTLFEMTTDNDGAPLIRLSNPEKKKSAEFK